MPLRTLGLAHPLGAGSSLCACELPQRPWVLGEVQTCLAGMCVSLLATLEAEVEPASGSLECLDLAFSER